MAKYKQEPFIIEFDHEEEMEKFTSWAEDKERDTSPEIERARNLLRETKKMSSMSRLNTVRLQGHNIAKAGLRRKKSRRGVVKDELGIHPTRK